jgi:hypothetical protein
MRRFHLVRHEDVTGVSGTGIVAEGVKFTDGSCAMRWITDLSSTTIYKDMETLIAIHSHDGRTVVEWLDKLSVEQKELPMGY